MAATLSGLPGEVVGAVVDEMTVGVGVTVTVPCTSVDSCASGVSPDPSHQEGYIAVHKQSVHWQNKWDTAGALNLRHNFQTTQAENTCQTN